MIEDWARTRNEDFNYYKYRKRLIHNVLGEGQVYA